MQLYPIDIVSNNFYYTNEIGENTCLLRLIFVFKRRWSDQN